MALPNSLCDREQAKFKEDDNGDTCVNVCGDLDVTTTLAGATGPVLATGFDVTDTSAEFPSTNQTGRISLSIRNNDSVESIFIVNSTGISKAAAGLDVWEIGSDETINLGLDDSNKVILVSESGKTVSITMLEMKGS